MSVVSVEPDCSLCVDRVDFHKSPSGIDCTFVKFGNTGLKLYKREYLRDRSYTNQHALSIMGVAPKVGHKTEVTVKTGREDSTYYAFETDIVNDVYDCHHYTDLIENDSYTAAKKYEGRFRDAARALTVELKDTITWNDNHAGNIGFDDAGNPMIIDCADNLFCV
jgi:hypothetical protein